MFLIHIPLEAWDWKTLCSSGIMFNGEKSEGQHTLVKKLQRRLKQAFTIILEVTGNYWSLWMKPLTSGYLLSPSTVSVSPQLEI